MDRALPRARGVRDQGRPLAAHRQGESGVGERALDALAHPQRVAVRLGRPPVVGDRVEIGAFVLTVREMGDKGRITALGLKCPPLGGGR